MQYDTRLVPERLTLAKKYEDFNVPMIPLSPSKKFNAACPLCQLYLSSACSIQYFLESDDICFNLFTQRQECFSALLELSTLHAPSLVSFCCSHCGWYAPLTSEGVPGERPFLLFV